MALAFGIRTVGDIIRCVRLSTLQREWFRSFVFLLRCRVVRLSRACSHRFRDSTRLVCIFLFDRANSTPQCPKEVSYFVSFTIVYFSTITKKLRVHVSNSRTCACWRPAVRLTFFGRALYMRLSAIALGCAGGYVYKFNEIMCFFQDVVVPPEPSSGYLSVCQSAPSSIVLIILVCITLGLMLMKYLIL